MFMRRMRKKIAKKLKAKQEAKAMIPSLFSKAKACRKKGDKRLHTVYSRKINYLKNKFKIKLDSVLKRQVCKHCYRVFIPLVNVRVRTRNGNVVYYCLDCKNYSKYGLNK